MFCFFTTNIHDRQWISDLGDLGEGKLTVFCIDHEFVDNGCGSGHFADTNVASAQDVHPDPAARFQQVERIGVPRPSARGNESIFAGFCSITTLVMAKGYIVFTVPIPASVWLQSFRRKLRIEKPSSGQVPVGSRR